MRCPDCGNEDVRAGECFELLYDLDDQNNPGELLNDREVLSGPEEYYFVCTNCWRRWDDQGHLLAPVFTVPEKVETSS